MSCYDQIKQLPDIKEDREEYQGIYSQVLQETLRRVDKAFKAFFRRVMSGQTPGYPRFQGKDRYDSFCYPQSGFGIEKQGDKKHVLILSKIGHIKIKLHRPILGAMKTCTVKREGEQWYVCISCETVVVPHTPYTDELVGVDMGVSKLATLSTGDVIENPKHYRCAEQRLVNLQKSVSRKKKGSHRRKKAVKQLSKAHRKVRNQRADYLHKHSRWLVNTFETIVFEDIKPANMSKRAKPKQDEESGQYLPNGASAKSGLNKSILDAGWTTFIFMCEYKAENAGLVNVVKVNPKNTSQICSACLKKGPHKDLSVRTHVCTYCGVVLDRDVNAAINIARLGQSHQERVS
ncbi:MAG: RNA-guided endonuclease TnpB family protein [Ktedonobacteraceae bacterium]